MSMIFSDDDYETKLQEYLDDSSMAFGSDFKEACFREEWERTRGTNKEAKTGFAQPIRTPDVLDDSKPNPSNK